MEKSDHYYRRRAHMQTLTVPTISEIKAELGEHLAEAFFVECPDPLKLDVGLTPTLQGAGDDLWISPSDTLIGKVCLKPPLTSKHMKALTHQGILHIGRDTEIKFWNEAEILKQKALAEQEEVLQFIAEGQKREAVKEAHREEWEICSNAKEQMRVEFGEKLKQELKQLEEQLREDYNDIMRQQKRELDEIWQKRLEKAVAETIENLTTKFLEDLAKQEEEMFKIFELEIKKEQIKCKMEIKLTQECCEETFLQLKHQLECKNIANMMYILCMERQKCQEERTKMESDYQKQVQDLQFAVTDKEMEITKLTLECETKTQQVNLREECLLEILRQFQKFINFALRASPTQAEFLLNIEKMMMFELTRSVCKTDLRYRKRLAMKLFPWKTDSEETLSTESSKPSLLADDYHECYNEVEPPISEHSLKSGDYLPAFYYDKHMYVREEFRNMMSQGIKVSPSNLIWNRDVEHLMQILRSSVTSVEEEDSTTKEESEETEAFTASSKHSIKSAEIKMDNPSFKETRRSTVHFDKCTNLLFPKFGKTSSLLHIDQSDLFTELSIKSKQCSTSDIISERECCTRCTQTLLKPSSTEYLDGRSIRSRKQSAVPLIGTVNSLELPRELDRSESYHVHERTVLQFEPPVRFESSINVSNDEDADAKQQEALGILSVKDSLIKHRMSLKPTSKIFLTRDSIIAPDVLELNRKSRDSGTQELHYSSKQELQKPLDEDILAKISKISLSRNSLLFNKHSQIMKKPPGTASSQDTVQLRKTTKPSTSTSASERTLTKAGLHKGKLSPPETGKVPVHKTASVLSIETAQSLQPGQSKLFMSKDSLQLLRSQSMVSAGLRGKRKADSKESIEIRNEILSSHTQRLSPISIKLDDDGSRAVKMSHIEILPLKEKQTIYCDEKDEEQEPLGSPYDTDEIIRPDSPWLIYKHKEIKVKSKKCLRDDFLTKPNAAEIVGSRKEDEHAQKSENFTLHRASSLLSIFKKHPSLVKIFSSCTK